MNAKQLEEYIAEAYGAVPDFPWEGDAKSRVFRHADNNKWFALVMEIPQEKLGRAGPGKVEILNVKCDALSIGSFRAEPGIYPAYHMSKASWLSVALDGEASDENLKMLLDISFWLTAKKKKAKRSL